MALGKDSKVPFPIARLEFRKYIFHISSIWILSWSLPGIVLFTFYYFNISPNLVSYASFWPVFSDWRLILGALFTPLLLILVYVFRLVMVAVLSKLALAYCNHISPAREMVAARGIGSEEARDVSVYWVRGAVLRILKWTFVKSPFPWLAVWAFNFVGTDRIAKGTVIEDGFFPQEFVETEENAYIGPGSIVSSHLVEGTYGAITLKKIIVGKGAVLSALNGISPGCMIGDFAELMPLAGMAKFSQAKPSEKYIYRPAWRISQRHYAKIMGYSPELLSQIQKLKVKRVQPQIQPQIQPQEAP